MSDTIIECAEAVGKIVQRLRLATSDTGGQEMHLEFTDGTAFSLTVEPATTRHAHLISESDESPKTIRSYDQ